ncbi:hypothetical protein TorRG33x02_239490, partial [Trema orientale]
IIPAKPQVQDPRETPKPEAALRDLDECLATRDHVTGPKEMSCELRLCPRPEGKFMDPGISHLTLRICLDAWEHIEDRVGSPSYLNNGPRLL